jgi:hypothetical protein
MYQEYEDNYEAQIGQYFEQNNSYSGEIPENELAYELMHVQSEEELEQFLGDLLQTAWKGAQAFYHSPLGQKLKNQAVAGLKNIGKKALPGLGRTFGGHFFGPQGAKIGGQLGKMAAKGLGLEFQGATALEKRTEGSRRMVRMARNAAQRIAAQVQQGQPISTRIIRQIILQEGQRSFPDLPVKSPGDMGKRNGLAGQQTQGRWYRQGNQIILEGI